MGNQALKKEEKRIGVIINTDGSYLENELETLSKYQEENNIERIHKYCITDDYGEDILFEDFQKFKDIDEVLLVGFYDEFEGNEGNYELIGKIKINFTTESVMVD